MVKVNNIDSTDSNILNQLLLNGEATLKQIAEKIGVTHGTVHQRVRKLRRSGVIIGMKAVLDWRLLGFSMSAFVGVTLHRARDCQKVLKMLESVPEVVEAYYSTGKYNIFIKVLLKDVDELHKFLMQRLQDFKEIQSTETLVILDSPLKRDRPV